MNNQSSSYEVVATADTHIGIFSIDDLKTAQAIVKGAERFAAVEKFKKIAFFESWHTDVIMSFYRELEHKFYKKGAVIYDIGDP